MFDDKTDKTTCLVYEFAQPKKALEAWDKISKLGYDPNPQANLVEHNWYNKMNFCGCGCPEEVLSFIKQILLSIEQKCESDWKIDTLDKVLEDKEASKYFILYALDAMGLTEHGGGVGCSWLSEEGKVFLKEIEKAEENDKI